MSTPITSVDLWRPSAGGNREVSRGSVATETWGQVSPEKFRNTDWEYWICVDSTMISTGAGISRGASTRKTGVGCPGLAGAGIFFDSPFFKIGIGSRCCTVSIQNVAVIATELAFGVVIAAFPSRKAMLSVPPPNGTVESGGVPTVNTMVWVIFGPAIASRSTVLGSSRMACVIVPAAMKFVRSWGMRGVVVRCDLAREGNKVGRARADDEWRDRNR